MSRDLLAGITIRESDAIPDGVAIFSDDKGRVLGAITGITTMEAQRMGTPREQQRRDDAPDSMYVVLWFWVAALLAIGFAGGLAFAPWLLS